MQKGDKVRVRAGGGQTNFFNAGAVGVLLHQEPNSIAWWVDFHNCGNPEGAFREDDGVWCVRTDCLEAADVLPLLETAQLQARVAELEGALRMFQKYEALADTDECLEMMKVYADFSDEVKRLLP